MKNNAFPHHSGGVVQVKHTTRYGVVPEALLEDKRLALDSRLVAAWLAVKQDGWQILIGSLRTRLVCGDQEVMGKDRWQRIANELESGGYLKRRRMHGTNGRWNWHITFSPIPEDATVAGYSGSGEESIAGSAGIGLYVDGLPAVGPTGDGQPGHKVIPREVIPHTVIPNKRPTTTDELRSAGATVAQLNLRVANENRCSQLHYPKVGRLELMEIENLMSFCPSEARQAVLDEIEGIRRTGGIKRSAVALAKGLVAKVANDSFILSAGHAVQIQRETRRQHAMALEASGAVRTEPLLPMSDQAIDSLPPNIASRVRQHAAKMLSGAEQVPDRPEVPTLMARSTTDAPTVRVPDVGTSFPE